MKIEELFLKAVRASLKNEEVQWTQEMSIEEWQAFFKLAVEQQVLAMVYHSIFRCQAFQKLDEQYRNYWKTRVKDTVFKQIRMTMEFQNLYQLLVEQGVEPIVVKGIICRMLYPNPDYRVSGDEDIYISEGTYEEYHQALLNAGMKVADWDAEGVNTSHEISYVKKQGILRIELHKSLFDEETAALEGMNEQFSTAFEDSILLDVNGCRIRTMQYTDHLLFLINHAFKHFVNSGFGIRQVCDLVMFANSYGDKIDWNKLLQECRKVQADVFAASLFGLGKKYLVFDEEKACYPKEWKALEAEPEAILEDLLSGGIYGSANMNRKHSASMTMNAVAADRSPNIKKNSILATAFPSVRELQNRFSYLYKYPFLLPLAWVQRIVKYGKALQEDKDNDVMESIKIGNQRIELMKKYGIIREQ